MKKMVVSGIVALALIGGAAATTINGWVRDDNIKTACIENGEIDNCDGICNEKQMCIHKEGNDGCNGCCSREGKIREENHVYRYMYEYRLGGCNESKNGNCNNECNLTNITGILTYDGKHFYVDDIQLHLGPEWYISSEEALYDYDRDGEIEIIMDELLGLNNTIVNITGHLHNDSISVFYINDVLYREPSKPAWAGGPSWAEKHQKQHGFPFKQKHMKQQKHKHFCL